jgi:hypothetical protein
MTDTQNLPLTDGELADRIVAAVRRGLQFATLDPVFPERAPAETVNAVLAVIHPELDKLRAELASVRRTALFDAAAMAADATDGLGGEALRHVIVSRIRVAALSNDACDKCSHRRGDHLDHGGICTLRTTSTTVCGCRRYGHPAAPTVVEG